MHKSRLLCLILMFTACSGQTGAGAPVVSPDSAASPAASSAPATSTTSTLSAPEQATAAPAIASVSPAVAASSAPPTVAVAPIKLATIIGKVVTQPARAARDAVVYLENAPLDKIVDTRLDDHQMTFFPFISVMTVGGTLTYVNGEPFPDTAFSPSNEKWDFGMVESHGKRQRKFEKPGNYTILCSLHPNQLAFLIVSPSSYFARTDKSGQFKIENVPAGSYQVVAWAPRLKSETRQATVAGEGEVSVDFELRR